jgi:tRNA (guanine-N7-)-methyltransferase
LRLRRKPWAKPELEKDSNVIFCPVELKGKWSSIFGNDHPIHLELGCGRGNFIARLAEKRQDINFIAIDMYPELLVYVSRKLNAGELKNVRIISI